MRLPRRDFDAVLASHPRRGDVPWAEEDGRAVLEVPKARGRVGAWLLRALRAPPSARAVLDPVGSDAWRLADGTRDVAAVARELAARHGEAAEPAEGRAVAFYLALRSRGLAELLPAPAAAPAPGPTGFAPEAGWRAAACPRCGGATRVRAEGPVRLRCPHCARVVRA